MDPFRPDQVTPIPNFFLAGSYTKQVGAGKGASAAAFRAGRRRRLRLWRGRAASPLARFARVPREAQTTGREKTNPKLRTDGLSALTRPNAPPFLPQDYIDSMEGATLSGRQCAYSILKAAPAIARAAAAEQKQRQEAVAA